MTWAVRLPQWKVGVKGGPQRRSLLVTVPSNAEVSFNMIQDDLTLFDMI